MEELEIILEVENDNELEINILEEEIKEVFPKLEDLEVIPTIEEQKFKSDKYGYNNVTVKAIKTEELTITPSTEEQVKEGIFNKVTVPTDADLKPENIKEGTNIFGVEGTANITNFVITDYNYMFCENARLDMIDELIGIRDKNNGITFNNAFYRSYDLTSLDLSHFGTINTIDMQYMFYVCSNLTEVDLRNFNTSNVTNMNYMFGNCKKLTSVNLSDFDTSNITSTPWMFQYCEQLTSLDLSNFDMSKATNVNGMFNGCNNLTNFKSFKNLGKAYSWTSANYSSYRLDLSYSTNLTHESLMSVINNLYDLNLSYNVANGGRLYTQNLKLGSTNLAKLTAEEIAIVTNKGWSVS